VIEARDLEFLQSFWARRARTAYIIFGLNILVYILMTLAGGSTNEATLLSFGVKSNPEIDSGEVWRFITPIFIHIGLLHLAFNSYALWVVGPHVEKLYGAPRFLLLYVLTGVAGVTASYFYHPEIISAGASGAIFGLFGVLLAFSFRYRKSVPQFFSQSIGKGMLMTVGINLVIGYMIPQVDNSAHIGGLVAGMLLAMIVPFERPGEAPNRELKIMEAGLAVLVASTFFMVATHYNGPGLSVSNALRGFQRGGANSSTGDFVYALNQAQQAFESSDRTLASDNTAGLSSAREELGKAIDLLQSVPSMSRRGDSVVQDLLDVLRKQYAYIEGVERTGNKSTDFIGASPQSRRYAQVQREIERWVDEEGERFGIVNTK
jgi:membrane associated rhomboid family serine protease